MFVKDINEDDRTEALGSCLNDRAYRIFSEAAELLTDKGLIDQLVGEISICVCAGFATLPPEVDTPLGVKVDAVPAILRNQWFTYHVNGPGDRGYTSCGYADILGNQFCTARDPDRPVKLALGIRSAQDAGKEFRVYGWDEDGERIHTPDADGQMQDGFLIPTIFGSLRTPTDVNPIVRFDRISKDEFVDFCDLYAVDPDTDEAISLLGSYRPKEKTPAYTRIRTSAKQVVTVKFRRRDFEIVGEDDWIACDHKAAFLTACKAVVRRRAEQWAAAEELEKIAIRMIKERQASRRPGGISPPQVTVSATNCHHSGMFYPH